MKKILPPLLLLFFVASFSQKQRTIFGKVTDGKNPIENVNISISAKDMATTTDKDGKYKIAIATGDVVEFSYTGLKTVKIKIEDVTRILNPVMIPDVTELDEVVVEASKRRSQKDMEEDYAINKNIIRTAWGLIDADRAPGNIQILTEEEVSPISICVLDLLKSRFPGIFVLGGCDGGGGGRVFIRGANSISNNRPAVFDVDGQIFTDTPVWIDVTNIKRLAILNNLASTVQYGSFGFGGVIVINTIIGANPKSSAIVDRARLKNNFVKGNVLTALEIAKNKPNYLKELEASRSFEEAKEVYLSSKNKYSNSVYFFIDAYNYFYEDLKEEEYADTLIKDNFRLFDNNPVLLKALAYNYDNQERFKKSHEVYKDIFIHRPNYVQSYMDVANSYRDIREPKKAAAMYARYEYLVGEGFLEQDTISSGPILEREYNNLLMLNKKAVVDGRKAEKLFVAEENFKGTRLVFEWNDSEAEFNLQFVNPENQYYTWKHSLADNSETIYREKDFGFNTTEYLLDGSLPGTWKINVNYLGNKSLTPTYLKATVYYNYGSSSQRKEIKMFKLSLKNVNQELFKIQDVNRVVSK